MPALSHAIADGTLTIELPDRLDTTNAPDVEASIEAICKDAGNPPVVLDCERLTYVSSTGLRVILRLGKRVGEVRIVNVAPAVYEVFEMTGFTELFEVTKAFRRISVDGCPVIGEGANGVVYRIDPDTICKVYRNPDALNEINRERELARTAFVSGIPTAIPYDVVRVGDGYGSVFELLDADSVASLLSSGTWTVEHVADECVRLLKQIAQTEVDPNVMPSIKDEALGWIDVLATRLTVEQTERLRELFLAIPDITRMIHGDFHIKNIMVQNGELLLIDMDTLSHGNPVFDLASTYNAYQGFSLVDHGTVERFMGIPYETASRLWSLILHGYFEGCGEEEVRAAEDKIRLVSSVRLMRRPIQRGELDQPGALEFVEAHQAVIGELLPRVESLAI
ncbi:MAG: anti-sigma factor antagonist [Atopobiaceae bacterium]|nr:anti-sigma factor antagonist [Atopobiaceae bacterium]